jgi:hypothetical protein
MPIMTASPVTDERIIHERTHQKNIDRYQGLLKTRPGEHEIDVIYLQNFCSDAAIHEPPTSSLSCEIGERRRLGPPLKARQSKKSPPILLN